MKRALKLALLVFATLALSFWGLQKCASSYWERALFGPYEGIPYTETIQTQPVSVLLVRGAGQLEVYEVPSKDVPVLLLRANDGQVRWARLLRPERRYDDGSVDTTFIRDLRLQSIGRGPDGYKVLLNCFWGWGGQEGGLIYLNADYSFRAFAELVNAYLSTHLCLIEYGKPAAAQYRTSSRRGKASDRASAPTVSA